MSQVTGYETKTKLLVKRKIPMSIKRIEEQQSDKRQSEVGITGKSDFETKLANN